MKVPFRELTIDDVKRAHTRAWHWAEEVQKKWIGFTEDPGREIRLKEDVECKACFYLDRFRAGGAAMTHWYCGLCKVEQRHGSTNTPRLCKACAKEHDLCSRCGADVHLQERKKIKRKK